MARATSNSAHEQSEDRAGASPDVGPTAATDLASLAGLSGPPAAATLLALQRSAGNRAVGALVGRLTPSPRRRLQRQKTAAELDADIDSAMHNQSGPSADWDRVAVTLNGFSSADILSRIRSDVRLTAYRREIMAAALRTMILWPPRAGGDPGVADTISQVEPAAARQGRIDYVMSESTASAPNWRGVALAINGFSEADIDDVMRQLALVAATSLAAIRTAAGQGWAVTRTIEGVDRYRRLRVAGEMETMADPANPLRAQWHGSGPGRGAGPGLRPSGYATDFAEWASAASESAFTVGPTTVINCWEMVLYAAFHSGQISWSWIHDIYTFGGGSWSAEMVRRLTPTGRRAFDRTTQTPLPRRGDIVLFDGINHVALATGNGTHTYTFWPPPDVTVRSAVDPGTGRRYALATPDRVKDYTIEELARACDDPASGHVCVVEFGPPPWQ